MEQASPEIEEQNQEEDQREEELEQRETQDMEQVEMVEESQEDKPMSPFVEVSPPCPPQDLSSKCVCSSLHLSFANKNLASSLFCVV